MIFAGVPRPLRLARQWHRFMRLDKEFIRRGPELQQFLHPLPQRGIFRGGRDQIQALRRRTIQAAGRVE
jgi:hypothetical protein